MPIMISMIARPRSAQERPLVGGAQFPLQAYDGWTSSRRGDPVITRRDVLLAGGIGLLVAHRFSHGQPAGTIRRVGLLSFSSEAAGVDRHLSGVRDAPLTRSPTRQINLSCERKTSEAACFLLSGRVASFSDSSAFLLASSESG